MTAISDQAGHTAAASAAERGVDDHPDGAKVAWDRIGAGYDEFVTPSHFRLGQEGLRRADLRPGMRFLDVAAGSGALSIPAARLGARVFATDISPVMLERLAQRARREGLDLETRPMDGHQLEFDDATFDVSGSQFGVMLFPDAPRALRELARVTRPGGRVLMNVFGNPAEVQFIQCFVAGLRAVRPDFPGLPADPPPLPFQFRDRETLRDALVQAGLHDIRIETVIETLEFESGETLWKWLVNSNPVVTGILDDLAVTTRELERLRTALDGLLEEHRHGSGPAALTNPVHVAVGTK